MPNAVVHLGSLLETFLPWLGLAIPGLMAVALPRRSAVALLTLMLPFVAWLGVFGERLLPRHDSASDITARSIHSRTRGRWISSRTGSTRTGTAG